MTKRLQVLVIGKGNIGKELILQIKKQGWEIVYVSSIDGIENAAGQIIAMPEEYPTCKDVDVVFLAIPTSDKGEKAVEYISYFTDKRIPVITCEKGSLAYNFSKLRPKMNLIGFNAAVGGGTRMLEYLSNREKSQITRVRAVVNGTLNFIWTELERGRNIEDIKNEALKKSYAEPGVKDLKGIVLGELKDVFMKAAILACQLSPTPISLSDIQLPENEALPLEKLIADPKNYRCFVSLDKKDNNDLLYGIKSPVSDWILTAGFYKISENSWLPKGVDNALVIEEAGSIYRISGPGAGPVATSLSMILDAKKLLNL